MRLVCISDTHGRHRDIAYIPSGDVLIHAGDSLRAGELHELEDLNDWLGELPHPHKILIAGNHDWCFQEAPVAASKTVTNAIYLQDSGTTIQGINFWGSPWTPWFNDWAFNLHRGPQIAQRWGMIPENTDVLITHGPPLHIFDTVFQPHPENVGCSDLLDRIERLSLKAHVFGHIHEGYGFAQREADGVKFANACTCNERYQPNNRPIIIDL